MTKNRFFPVELNSYKKYLKNIIWQGSGNSLAQLLNILSIPVITRLFEPAALGTFSYFTQLLPLASILISFRVEQVIIIPKSRAKAKHLMMFVSSLGLISCMLMVVLGVVLTAVGLFEKGYVFWLLLLPLAAYFNSMAQAAQQLSQRSAGFKSSAASEFINRLFNNGTSILLGLVSASPIFLAIGFVFGVVAKIISLKRALIGLKLFHISSIKTGFMIIREENIIKRLYSLITSHIILAISSITPITFITYKYGIEFAGYYSLALSTLALPTSLLGRAVGQVFYQRANQIYLSHKSFVKLQLITSLFLLLIIFPVFVVVFAFGDIIYLFVFGQPWLVAGQAAQIMIFSACFAFLSVPFDRAAVIANAWWWGPSWHSGRLIGSCVALLVAHLIDADFLAYLAFLTISQTAFYIIDWCASLSFSLTRRPT